MTEKPQNSGVSRRKFIKHSGQGFALGAGLGLFGSAFAQKNAAGAGESIAGNPLPPGQAVGRPMPELQNEMPAAPGKRLNWAVVGLGKFALNQIIPSFQDTQYCKLTALVSGSPEKAQNVAQHYGVNPASIYNYETMDRLADNADVDIVYIILPNGLHAQYTIKALKAGKHVMCEKPMAVSVPECEAMIQAANEAKRKLMIAYREQYEPHNLEAIRLVQSGELGDVRLITTDHGRIADPGDPSDIWRLDRELAGGGSLMDIGVYGLNAARYLTGEEPAETQAWISNPKGDPRFKQVEDLVTFQLRFPSGILVNGSSSYSYADAKRYQVFGSKAVLTMDPATDYYRHRLTVESEDGRRMPQIKETNQFAAEMDHLAECVMQDKAPKTPGEEGLRDVRYMMAIYDSAAQGGKLIKLN